MITEGLCGLCLPMEDQASWKEVSAMGRPSIYLTQEAGDPCRPQL